MEGLGNEFATSNYYPKVDTGFARLPALKYIAIFCWFAAHEAAAFRDVSERFDIAISTLFVIIRDVGLFLSNKSKDIITWPTREEQIIIKREFEEMGFPNLLGCIDGTHIKIDQPSHDADSYRNRKKYFSINMQAVCDSKRKIRDVFIGYPGSVHDARVFANSPVRHTLHSKCGDNYIVGDSAYPCLRNLMTPYRDRGNLSETQKKFNKKLSHVRVTIEHTFGILKQKFRQLFHLKLRSIQTICHFIRACCVLHNLSIGVEEELEDVEEVEGQLHYPLENVDEEDEGDEEGILYRNYLAAALNI